jgi:hypothetical protein
MKEISFDDPYMKHLEVLAAIDECVALELMHFGTPVTWTLTSVVSLWPSDVPLPVSPVLGAIQVVEA